MAELKPVPKGYDENALGSMLSYLANARKSHDNNPGMRVLLDQQARDQLGDYLSDADLTRSTQVHDNDAVSRLNMAALIQKDASERAQRGREILQHNGVTTAPLANDQGLPYLGDDDVLSTLAAASKEQRMKPVVQQAEVANKNANTEKTLMDTIEGRTNVGDWSPIPNTHDLPDVVMPDPTKAARTLSSAAQGRDAKTVEVKSQQGGKYIQNVAIAPDGTRQRFHGNAEQRKQLEKAGYQIVPVEMNYNESESNTTRDNEPFNQGPPKTENKVSKPITDLEQAKTRLAEEGHKVDGLRVVNGQVQALINGTWNIVGE